MKKAIHALCPSGKGNAKIKNWSIVTLVGLCCVTFCGRPSMQGPPPDVGALWDRFSTGSREGELLRTEGQIRLTAESGRKVKIEYAAAAAVGRFRCDLFGPFGTGTLSIRKRGDTTCFSSPGDSVHCTMQPGSIVERLIGRKLDMDIMQSILTGRPHVPSQDHYQYHISGDTIIFSDSARAWEVRTDLWGKRYWEYREAPTPETAIRLSWKKLSEGHAREVRMDVEKGPQGRISVKRNSRLEEIDEGLFGF